MHFRFQPGKDSDFGQVTKITTLPETIDLWAGARVIF